MPNVDKLAGEMGDIRQKLKKNRLLNGSKRGKYEKIYQKNNSLFF